MTKALTTALASYKSIQAYMPKFADFIVWKRWFRTQFGVVNNWDARTGVLSIIFENTPRLLVTMTEDEMRAVTVLIKLADIKERKHGSWYVQQVTDGQNVWYV